MVHMKQGDILQDTEAEALVNTVNTQGVMGKGLAFAFKQRFPENYEFYRSKCKEGQVQIGKMLVFRTGLLQPQYIINFPTKKHWRERSQLEYIKEGLEDLKQVVREYGIRSLAIPPLGCGQGGLDWEVVRRLITEAFDALPEVKVYLYEPSVPEITPLEAGVIKLIAAYSEVSPGPTREEVELLAQILLSPDNETQGKKGRKSRRSPTPKKLVQRLIHIPLLKAERVDGDYLYGVPSTVREQAQKVLETHPEWAERTQQALELIQGFESLEGLKTLVPMYAIWSRLHQPSYFQAVIERIVQFQQRHK